MNKKIKKEKQTIIEGKTYRSNQININDYIRKLIILELNKKDFDKKS